MRRDLNKILGWWDAYSDLGLLKKESNVWRPRVWALVTSLITRENNPLVCLEVSLPPPPPPLTKQKIRQLGRSFLFRTDLWARIRPPPLLSLSLSLSLTFLNCLYRWRSCPTQPWNWDNPSMKWIQFSDASQKKEERQTDRARCLWTKYRLPSQIMHWLGKSKRSFRAL